MSVLSSNMPTIPGYYYLFLFISIKGDFGIEILCFPLFFQKPFFFRPSRSVRHVFQVTVYGSQVFGALEIFDWLKLKHLCYRIQAFIRS